MEKFYPLISLNLFNEAIQYPSTITEKSDSDKTIIKHSTKALLFHKNHPWEKKSEDPGFDVPMGCYDGAEICEWVGIFILNKLCNIWNDEIKCIWNYVSEMRKEKAKVAKKYLWKQNLKSFSNETLDFFFRRFCFSYILDLA